LAAALLVDFVPSRLRSAGGCETFGDGAVVAVDPPAYPTATATVQEPLEVKYYPSTSRPGRVTSIFTAEIMGSQSDTSGMLLKRLQRMWPRGLRWPPATTAWPGSTLRIALTKMQSRLAGSQRNPEQRRILLYAPSETW